MKKTSMLMRVLLLVMVMMLALTSCFGGNEGGEGSGEQGGGEGGGNEGGGGSEGAPFPPSHPFHGRVRGR